MDLRESSWVDFSELQPEVRALAMVGGFLQEFARMEDSLEEAIGTLAGLRQEHIIFLFEHLPITRKITLLKAMLRALNLEKPKLDPVLSALSEMYALNQDVRNKVAHTLFRAEPTGLAITEMGHDGAVRERWTWSDFEAEIDKCRSARRPVLQLMVDQQWERLRANFSKLLKSSAGRHKLSDELLPSDDSDMWSRIIAEQFGGTRLE